MNETLSNALKKLRLSGMAKTMDIRLEEAKSSRLIHSEFLELILQDELDVRKERLGSSVRIPRPPLPGLVALYGSRSHGLRHGLFSATPAGVEGVAAQTRWDTTYGKLCLSPNTVLCVLSLRERARAAEYPRSRSERPRRTRS